MEVPPAQRTGAMRPPPDYLDTLYSCLNAHFKDFGFVGPVVGPAQVTPCVMDEESNIHRMLLESWDNAYGERSRSVDATTARLLWITK